MVRQKAFQMFEFVGTIGGLLSLYASFSVIIAIEITLNVFIVMKTKIIGTRKRKKIILVIPQSLIQDKRKFRLKQDHALCDIFEHLKKFAESSNIHGINNIVNKKKHPKEKVFWSLIISVCAALCIRLIFDSLNHAELNAIEIGFDEKVWTINDVRL